MEHLWSDNVKRKPKYLEENLTKFQFVHNKSHVDASMRETQPYA